MDPVLQQSDRRVKLDKEEETTPCRTKGPQRDRSMEDIEIKDTDSAPKSLGLELAFDNGRDKSQLE